MHKKIPKICTGCRVSAAKIYLYHSTKIAKARPHRVEWQTDSSVQEQWFMTYLSYYILYTTFVCLCICCSLFLLSFAVSQRGLFHKLHLLKVHIYQHPKWVSFLLKNKNFVSVSTGYKNSLVIFFADKTNQDHLVLYCWVHFAEYESLWIYSEPIFLLFTFFFLHLSPKCIWFFQYDLCRFKPHLTRKGTKHDSPSLSIVQCKL